MEILRAVKSIETDTIGTTKYPFTVDSALWRLTLPGFDQKTIKLGTQLFLFYTFMNL